MKAIISKSTRYEKSIFIIVFFSTFMLVQFGIFDLFWCLQVVFFLAHTIITRKLRITRDRTIISLYCIWVLSTLLCFVSDIPLSYKKNSIIAIVFLVPTFFTVSFYEGYIRSERFVAYIKKALALTCTVQVIVCIAQFILYNGAHIDLNQLVFRNILHMVENPSQYKLGVFHPSGMCWHSAFMAPIVIIAFVVCDSYFVKTLAVVDAVICNNATAMIGIGVCLVLTATFSFVGFLKKMSKKVRKRTIISASLIAVAIIPILFCTDVVPVVSEKIVDIYGRATGAVYDGGSANAHIRYFTAYPNVVKNGSVIQFLFGYGTGNSGYTMSKLYGQYADLKSWVVETDIMNQIYSNGIIGFILYYSFLLYIAIRGYKLNRKYFILMISIILAGITYNIQFDWVLFIEFLLFLTIKFKVDLFETGK